MAWQVFFDHVEVHTQSSLECLEVAEGTLNRHASPAGEMVEMLFSAVQVPHVEIHEPGEERAGGKGCNNYTNFDTRSVESIFHHLDGGRIEKEPGIMGTAYPASEDVGELSAVVAHALNHNGGKALGMTRGWECR